jgi:DNA-binding NarL/FixJ family response regulator
MTDHWTDHPGMTDYRFAHPGVTDGVRMRVVIAEDSAVLREGMVRLLAYRGHEVVGQAVDGDELLAAVAAHRPDVAVVDVRMPPTHTDEGLRAALAIQKDHPDVGILIFSQYVEVRYATRLITARTRGIGYLLKERVSDVNDFVDALGQIAAGGTVLDPEIVSQLLAASTHRDTIDALSRREHEVLALMAQGRSNAAIAKELVITGRAVEKHISGIFLKLDIAPSTDDHRRVMAVLRYLNHSTA